MFPYQNTKIPNFAKTKKLISKGIDIFIFHKSSQFYDILTHNCIVFWCTSRTIKKTANKEENLFHGSKLTFERVIAVYNREWN